MSPESNYAAAPQSANSLTHLEDREEATDVSRIHAAILREKADPLEGMEPVSLWLIALTGILLFWGGYYLQSYSGGFKPLVYDENAASQTTAAAIAAPPPDPLALGREKFAICAACHLAEGEGNPANQVPPLAGSEWVNDSNPAKIIRIVLKGLKGPIKVKGQDFPGTATTMLAVGDNLTDAEAAAVLTYIRASWGNKASPVKTEEVADIRGKLKDRTDQWTVADLEKDVAASGGAATTTGGTAPQTPEDIEKLLKTLPPDQLKQILNAVSPQK